MGISVGIDLGSTYSSVAYLDPRTKEMHLIPNAEGELKTPSEIVALSDGTFLFGQEALDKSYALEGERIPCFRTCMETKEYSYKAGSTVYDASNVTARYIEYLLHNAREVIGQEITEAAVSVPAIFSDRERRILKDAFTEAGVKICTMVNDTTAAALAYSYRNQTVTKTFLVYKLGGGIFEAAVVKISQGQVYVLLSTGDRELGSGQWEEILCAYLLEQYTHEFGEGILEDKVECMKIRRLAQQIKVRLSQVSTAQATIHYKGNTGSYVVTREMFWQMTKTVFQLTLQRTEDLLGQLMLEPEKLDGILFVGGATKLPMVRQEVEERFLNKGVLGINPDYDTCYGAAIRAELEGRVRLALVEQKIHEIVVSSLGMVSISLDGSWYVNSIMLHKNSKIPCSNTRTFRLSVPEDGGRMVIYMLQGEAPTPKDCLVTGKYVIDGIAYIEGGTTHIMVTYTYDENAMVHVSARQKETGELLSMHREVVPADMDWVMGKPEQGDTLTSGKEEGILYLCVDLSGSMAGVPFMETKKAIKDLVEGLDLSCRKIGIIGFADHSQLILTPTSNMKNISRTLQRLHISGRMFGYGSGTSPFAMVYERHCEEEKILQKTVDMLVFTDGAWPDRQRAMMVAGHLKEKGIGIYTMAFGRADTQFLRQLSSYKELSEFTDPKKEKREWMTIAQIVSEEDTK